MSNQKMDEFSQLDVENVCEFLGNDNLKVSTEMTVFRGALEWLSYGQRLDNFQKVMESVRFRDMTPKELMECHEIVKGMEKIWLNAYCSIIPRLMAGQLKDNINVPNAARRTCVAEQSALELLLNNIRSRDDPCSEAGKNEYVVEKEQENKVKSKGKKLRKSIELLQEKCESGEAVAEYEQLEERRADKSMSAARKYHNKDKNRYKDILPYDETRVKLNGKCDYINANHMKMDITGMKKINHYIASQGPLQQTSNDFWMMTWEQKSPMVIMLTTEVEQGRVKCHRYWSECGQTANYGDIKVTCTREVVSFGSIERAFKLVHLKTKEERIMSHFQYTAWPDHGVPDDAADFLDFLHIVREKTGGFVDPIIIHCSAGVGRTGVFITLDTALSLMESNQPVYPLEIVKKLRDQREKCVQRTEQYQFICNAVIKVYNEMITKESQSEKRPSRWRRVINSLSKMCCSFGRMCCCCFGVKEKSTKTAPQKRAYSYRGHRSWRHRRK